MVTWSMDYPSYSDGYSPYHTRRPSDQFDSSQLDQVGIDRDLFANDGVELFRAVIHRHDSVWREFALHGRQRLGGLVVHLVDNRARRFGGYEDCLLYTSPSPR